MALHFTEFRAMGSTFRVWLETAADGEAILSRVPQQVEAIEACLSRFRPESELSLVNARHGRWTAVSEVTLQAVTQAKQAARLTGGFYNPLVLPALLAAGYTRSFDALADDAADVTLPPTPGTIHDWRNILINVRRSEVMIPHGAQIDLGGSAKGWTAERIADDLFIHGPCLVDAGGDLVARGAPQGQLGWRIMVNEPGEAEADALAIRVRDAAVVTSGVDFRRWQHNGQSQHHLIDPRSGLPAETDVQTATIVHPAATVAEGFAKAVLLQGSEAGLHWLDQQWKGAGMIIRDDQAILATPEFETYLV